LGVEGYLLTEELVLMLGYLLLGIDPLSVDPCLLFLLVGLLLDRKELHT
jgi:hypothetical protein